MTFPSNAPTELQLTLARTFHAIHCHADRDALLDVLASLEQPVLPDHVWEWIQSALKGERL